jgi:hypothetical protein
VTSLLKTAQSECHLIDDIAVEGRREQGGGRGRAEATARARTFFVGAGLPVFLLAAVAVYEAFLLALVFAPADLGANSARGVSARIRARAAWSGRRSG